MRRTGQESLALGVLLVSLLLLGRGPGGLVSISGVCDVGLESVGLGLRLGRSTTQRAVSRAAEGDEATHRGRIRRGDVEHHTVIWVVRRQGILAGCWCCGAGGGRSRVPGERGARAGRTGLHKIKIANLATGDEQAALEATDHLGSCLWTERARFVGVAGRRGCRLSPRTHGRPIRATAGQSRPSQTGESERKHTPASGASRHSLST